MVEKRGFLYEHQNFSLKDQVTIIFWVLDDERFRQLQKTILNTQSNLITLILINGGIGKVLMLKLQKV